MSDIQPGEYETINTTVENTEDDTVGYISAELSACLFGQISPQSETLRHIAAHIQNMPHMQTIYTPTKLTSPYDITDRQAFDLYINGYGRDLTAFSSFAALLALMRARGAIIRTNIIGTARDAAGLLAILGTPGFRIMYESATLVPYTSACQRNLGFVAPSSIRPTNSEIEYIRSIYKKNTKLSNDEITDMMQNSQPITATQCLKRGLCDWILQNNGKMRGRHR